MKINLPFNYQLKLYGSKVEQRVGICSQHIDSTDKHCLLWDFDYVESEFDLIVTLLRLQTKFHLPNIYVIESSPNKLHAYCFKGCSFREVIHILSDTPQIDMKYLRLGMVRGYYTLRVTPRKGDSFRLITTLASFIKETITPMDLTVNNYLTTNLGGGNNA